MSRATDAEKTQRLNAAHELVSSGHELAVAAESLTARYGMSRRQAYRYLQEAQRIGRPVPVAEPTVPITIKVPAHVVQKLRAYAQARGLTMGEIVARALLVLLSKVRRRG